MILHGNQRGNSKDLAHHLQKEENERHRQVIGDLRNDSPGVGSQSAFSSRMMSPQIQCASALACL